jgi:hypothetical protein
MAFIGTPLDTRNTFQSLQGKRFNGDGSTTAFTLDVAPSSTLDIEVFVGNVRQDPNSAYTLSGTTLTFTGAPPSGTNNIYVVHQAKSVGTIDVPALGVSTASIQADAITEAKIADDAVESEHLNDNIISGQTELAATPADTDEFLISDAGTIKRIDYSYIKTSSSFTKIATVNSTSDASFVELQNCFNSTYQSYLVVMRLAIPATSGEGLRLRLMTSTNTAVNGSNYRYASRYFDHDGSASSNTGNNQTSWQLADAIASAEGNGGATAAMWFNVDTGDTAGASGRFTGTLSYSDGNGVQHSAYIGGYHNTDYNSTATTGLEWFATSGNIAKLQATCYGVTL